MIVLTNGEANTEGNVSDGIHPSIDSTAKKFMNKIGSYDDTGCKSINEKWLDFVGKGKQLLKWNQNQKSFWLEGQI